VTPTPSTLQVSRILHAGYVFECGTTQIAFDPIFENPFSRNCHAFPNVQWDFDGIKALSFSAVFISHFHDDHCSLESLDLLNRQTPIYLYCVYEELFSLIRELGFQNVHPLELGVPVRIGAFEVTPRRALDSDVDSLFQIQAAGFRILNVVDSWIDSSMLEELVRKGPWDMVLWPFQTMREIEVLSPTRAAPAPTQLPAEWIEQLKILNPKYIVPSSCQFIQESWSWYNHALFPISYRQFQEEVQSALPECQVVRLNPSTTVILEVGSLRAGPSLSWVQPVGEQDVDYEYDRERKAPSTAEIARYFAALTAEQKKEMNEYCSSGILEKYHSMGPPLDEYFEKSRRWRLSVFDHTGAVTHFDYLLKGARIERALGSEERLSWYTEIPLSKLYAALKLGESLTSLYMRINDVVFEPEIEKELKSVDIVEDPLIRCLFTGVFGAYQIAQLRRLKGKHEHHSNF
jgi:L-ascorbate metabolism protein UlaG (beta-lactamase superfamily)